MGSGARSSSYRAPSRTVNNYQSTTIVRPAYAPPPVVVTPSVGFGYSPFGGVGGFGLGYGVGAVANDIGNTMRDMRQENEIQDSRRQLEDTKLKNIELEA